MLCTLNDILTNFVKLIVSPKDVSNLLCTPSGNHVPFLRAGVESINPGRYFEPWTDDSVEAVRQYLVPSVLSLSSTLINQTQNLPGCIHSLASKRDRGVCVSSLHEPGKPNQRLRVSVRKEP